ncbi:MAG: glycosyltransferase [Magnetospiraceae bacterium]
MGHKAVLILGMHRSGTSALTAGVSALGFTLGGGENARDSDNPKGYFENIDIVELNNRILLENGGFWAAPGFGRAVDWTADSFTRFIPEAQDLLNTHYGAGGNWVLKDPRMCLLLPFWQPLITDQMGAEIRYLHITRNPLEVALSQQSRRRAGGPVHLLGDDPRYTLALWYAYYREAARHLDNDQNLVLDYQDLLEEPGQQLSRVAGFLDTACTPETLSWFTGSFIEGRLRRNKAAAAGKRYPGFAFIDATYNSLRALGAQGTLPAKRFQAVFADDSLPVALIDGLVDAMVEPAGRLARRNAELLKSEAAFEFHRSQVDKERTVHAEQIVYRDKIIEDYKAEIARHVERAEHLTAIIGENRRLIARHEQEIQAHWEEITRQRQEISRLTGEARRGAAYFRMFFRLWRFLEKTKLYPLMRRLGWKMESDDWREKLARSGLFDAAWYVAQNPDVAGSRLRPLDHYLMLGGFEGRNPNRFFDSRWYLNTYNDIQATGLNPLLHYVLHGAAEGRACSPAFDTAAYVDRYPDVAATGMNPLGHYLKHGLAEGRSGRALPPADRPAAPDWTAFDSLARENRGRAAAAVVGQSGIVDVIVPVYRGYADTLACLYSVLAAPAQTPFELVVLDDASPEPDLSAALQRLADLGLITLLVNETNKGFVGTVNRGMALHDDRDVVLLNSDTEVYNDWIDRLVGQGRAEKVGTATPFSNNATICSYPHKNVDNPRLLEIDYAELDRLFAAQNPGAAVDVPTGVGFCMFIARAALQDQGAFDEAAFGKGYGEENDFCMRIGKAGWRNLLIGDVFVRHTGETSFAETAVANRQVGAAALLAKHPDYDAKVALYIQADPAAEMRQRIDAARLARHVGGTGVVLAISHDWGGGIARYLSDAKEALKAEGLGLVTVTPAEPGSCNAKFPPLEDHDLPNLNGITLWGDDPQALALLKDLNVVRIEVHSLAGWSAAMLTQIPALCAAAGIPYHFSIHDYIPICPRMTFVDPSNYYCGEEGVAQCARCLTHKTDRPPVVHPDLTAPYYEIGVERWRDRYGALIQGAQTVSAPSGDTAARFNRYFPEVSIDVVPHEDWTENTAPPVAAPFQAGQPLRLVTLGGVGVHKGARVLKACAEDALARGLPLEFVIIGYTDDDSAFASLPNVRITGAYEEADVARLLAAQEAHAAFLPAICPETFSYTLTTAVRNGFPVICFDIGAPAERLRDGGIGTVLPYDLARDPAALNDALLAQVQD